MLLCVRRVLTVGLLASCAGTALNAAQTVVPGSKNTAHAASQSSGEARAARAFDAAKKLGAPELYAFLKPMPKGADLHMHLSGAVYAETFIAEAAKAALCVAPPPPSCTVGTISQPDSQSPPARTAAPPPRNCPVPVLDPKMPPVPLHFTQPVANKSCGPGQLPATDALVNQPLYDALVDSFSMRGYWPSEGITGHDHFFATFDRFGGLKDFTPEWLDEVAVRAAAQNEQYLEIMQTPGFTRAREIGYKLGWPAGAEAAVTRERLARLREALLAGGLKGRR